MELELFWKNKKVFITGHTGFKGSWLCLWLSQLGAKVYGYALEPPTNPSLFQLANISNSLEKSYIKDIRDKNALFTAIQEAKPEIIFHLAAQPLVRDSYQNPVDTYEINVNGTINLLESIRKTNSVSSFLNVTTDKVYENKEWVWSYRENEPLGGYDPYSNSKACSELVTSSYRSSYFNPLQHKKHGVGIATARAGNVIGGGDFATDRLIPDIIRSIVNKEKVFIRNPNSIRPWQHVLEPLSGYMILAQKLYEDGAEYSDSFNFGPTDGDTKTVVEIVNQFKAVCKAKNLWNVEYEIVQGEHPHEANYLKLDISKARNKLGWDPQWSLDIALKKIIEWTEAWEKGNNVQDVCLRQIQEYEG
ncbi:MAG: CDP-glucose 4,6-dehydratase [Flavobacteriales bacterium]|nr:CDP-glucose 4,6-dehydratase [Flavobacteriales bacterium]